MIAALEKLFEIIVVASKEAGSFIILNKTTAELLFSSTSSSIFFEFMFLQADSEAETIADIAKRKNNKTKYNRLLLSGSRVNYLQITHKSIIKIKSTLNIIS